ncbi:hypothetical protein LAZ67_17001149 [Cordylochernes scorpioides]|uniref:Glucose-methanol-choline oxidoreductase N-terminal domain-containing protein n=1 Tax=Cordylochernes scorpioides TaxID=51811 RepID=A0ABY6LHZ0_9ARAC|nr:hypothetical protein LAZ67_17001149 [Cordylochernes scorpioides]
MSWLRGKPLLYAQVLRHRTSGAMASAGRLTLFGCGENSDPLISLSQPWFWKEVYHDWCSLAEWNVVLQGPVGGGSSGAVVTSRLAEDSTTRVLLLEAGGVPDRISNIPMMAMLLQMGRLDWKYLTVPQDKACSGLKDRQSRWPRGKVLGGSSIINTNIYHRGNRRDYDQWEREGNTGWGWKDIFPYFLKSEDNRDPDIASNVCARWVPRLLSENHTQQRMEAARAFLVVHRRDGDQLFSRIVTGDESWVHHPTPETKR